MKQKLFLIVKTFIYDGLIEPDTEVYTTKEERDKAWDSLVLSHNNMVIDCFGIELNHIPEEYYYEWGNDELEFYCHDDPEMHHDYFVKSETTIEVFHENN